MRQVEIDLNVRVRGNWTLAGIEDADGPVEPGQAVRVFEPESGAVGVGRVEEVDPDRRVIFLSVRWGSITIPDASMAARLGGLFSVVEGPAVAADPGPRPWSRVGWSSGIACSA